MDLLERDQFLGELAELLPLAAVGSGRTVLVSGEAGIGKTALVERFVEAQQPEVRMLWGACEALFTPRPLGPLHDIARQAGGRLMTLLEREADRATLFTAFLDEFHMKPLPTVVIFEDVHWADEATLDLIKYVGRRIHQASALLIVTYRDDEIGPEHPLWAVLGDLPSRSVTRLRLPPLSETAVAQLAARSRRPAASLYAATGGNPFFVTEVLASEQPGVPVTVRDAVLARAARLSTGARSVLDLAAVVPARIEQQILETVTGASSAALEECVAAGILRLEGGATAAFHHELARQAVESALSLPRQRALHAQVLHALLQGGYEQSQVARLVHHAALAGDSEHVLQFAPAAAQQAAAQGAHREAAAHYATALRFANALEVERRAELYEGRSYECYLTNQGEEAIQAREAALAIWRSLERKDKVGQNLRWLSRLSWILGRGTEAERHAVEAVYLLESLPPTRELAMAYSNRAQLRMLAGDVANTMLWGRRAIELAERLADHETLCHALNNVGTAQLTAGDGRGTVPLERSLQLALEYGFEEHAARAYTNLACCAIQAHEYARGALYLADGIRYCGDRDLDSWRLYMTAWRARASFEQGDWVGAGDDAQLVLDSFRVLVAGRIPALVVLGRVRVRRGDPGAGPVLDEARGLALATGELQRIGPAAAARAEWRWLQGQREECLAEARVGFQLALAHSDPWMLGEVGYWLWQAGGLADPPSGAAEPYALQIAGDWRAAADAWERIGCPYEQALALADGDEQAQRDALAIFERLGASPAAGTMRHRLRIAGVRGLPRGPRPTTRRNPLGLTNRQLEILQLMAAGLHNAEIAEQLSMSPKTVDHHVSAVLAKLDVASRAQAVAVAYQLGIALEANVFGMRHNAR